MDFTLTPCLVKWPLPIPSLIAKLLPITPHSTPSPHPHVYSFTWLPCSTLTHVPPTHPRDELSLPESAELLSVNCYHQLCLYIFSVFCHFTTP